MASRTTASTSASTNTVTVRFDREVRLLWAHLDYTSAVGAGNRQIEMSLLDPSGTSYFDTFAGTTQAVSLTYHYEFLQGIYRETSVSANSLQCPFPKDFIIPGGWSVKFHDNADIDATNDSLTLTYQTESM